MASYQDIEIRLKVVEAKIDFALRTFAVTRSYEHPLMPGKVINEQKTLLDIYHEANSLGMSIADVVKPDIEPTTTTVDPLAAATENVNG